MPILIQAPIDGLSSSLPILPSHVGHSNNLLSQTLLCIPLAQDGPAP